MHRSVGWWALGFAAPLGFALALGGCGNGDDASSQPAVDGGADARIDATTQEDAGQDSASDQTTSEDGAAGSCILFDASALDEAAVASGLALVANVYNCWKCHQNGPPDAGLTLEGRDASIDEAGLIFPPNLTPDPTGLGCWTDEQIRNAFLSGMGPDGGELCGMPKFGKVTNDAGTEPIDAATAGQIVEFLRGLSPVSYVAPSTTCPAAGGDGGEEGGDASLDADGGGE